jgi:segregation and condensation protein B
MTERPEFEVVTEAYGEDDPADQAYDDLAADMTDDAPELTDPAALAAALESVLLVVDEPVSPVQLAQVLERPRAEIEEALHALAASYDAGKRGIDLREVAGGWRFYTRNEYAPYVERFVLDGQQSRLTQAALETLAVIAYRQPVTRSRISAIRGVGVDGVMRTLLARGLVEEVGTEPETGGHLYQTTSLFLERLGLNSLEDLPPLAPLLPEIDGLDDLTDDLSVELAGGGGHGVAHGVAHGVGLEEPAGEPADERSDETPDGGSEH